jgi:endonuclease III
LCTTVLHISQQPTKTHSEAPTTMAELAELPGVGKAKAAMVAGAVLPLFQD